MERLCIHVCMCGGGEPCMHEHVEVEKEVPMEGGRAETKMIDPGKLKSTQYC